MWPFVKDLLHRGYDEALAKGGSTRVSVWWLGFGVLVLGFVFTVGIEWLTGGRNRTALALALKSWKSFLGAFSALLLAWLCLFIFSVFGVAYTDHQLLLTAQAKACPPCMKQETSPARNSTLSGHTQVSVRIKQGNGGTANPGVVTAPITQNGDCNVTQVGGSDNSASPNCEKNPNKPRILYSPNGTRRWELGPTVEMQTGESPQYQKMIEFEKNSNWQALADLSEAEIAKAPTWLSPYGLSALAYAHLCNKELALKRGNYFLEEAMDNPEYSEGDFIAPAKRVNEQLARGLLPSECPKPQ